MLKIFKKNKDRQYLIGNKQITIQGNCRLPKYQKKFKLYDKQLPKIIKIIEATNPNSVIIDIGANIGAMAVAIRNDSKLPIYCVEGSNFYLPYLRKNTANSSNVTIVNAFIGDDEKEMNAVLDVQGGGGRILQNNSASAQQKDDSNKIKTYKLITILNENSIADKVSLIKIDTDGFDFKIINSSLDYIKKQQPNIFFEYELTSESDKNDSLITIKNLLEIGYQFVVYDNFGNYMLTTNNIKSFEDINRFILSSKTSGGGIYYVDVLATKSDELVTKIQVL